MLLLGPTETVLNILKIGLAKKTHKITFEDGTTYRTYIKNSNKYNFKSLKVILSKPNISP